MTEPYRRPEPPHPRRRRRVLALGAIVTLLALGGIIWSVFMWPTTCGTLFTSVEAIDR